VIMGLGDETKHSFRYARRESPFLSQERGFGIHSFLEPVSVETA